MYSAEESKRRFEILKMAKEMLGEEYTLKRATEHNKWLAESQEVWTKHHITIAHPPFAPYPTEKEVIAAAKVLYDFISGEEEIIPDPVVMPPVIIEKIVEKIVEVIVERPVEVIVEKVIDPIVEQLPEHLEKEDDRHHNDGHYSNKRNHSNHKHHSDHHNDHQVSDEVSDKEESRMKDLLPGWIRRTTK